MYRGVLLAASPPVLALILQKFPPVHGLGSHPTVLFGGLPFRNSTELAGDPFCGERECP